MNLLELKEKVEAAIEGAIEYGDDPKNVPVSIQVGDFFGSVWSTDVTLYYDNDCSASGCVLVGAETGRERWIGGKENG